MADESHSVTAAEATTDTVSKQVAPANGEKPTDASVAGVEGNTAAEETKTNGEAEKATNSADDEAEEDLEMKDTEDSAVAGSSEPAPPPQSTPASIKKAANGSTKKKSAGVPEHKTKKLNKKKSQPKLTHLDAEPGDLFLARMKGHPQWPSIIADEEMLPQSLIDTRPVTTKLPDGTFKKPEYGDGGKRAFERTFPVMFLQTNEFAWLPNTDLTPLEPADCANVEAKGKNKSLLAAYEKAAENQTLDYYKTALQDHMVAVQADAEAQADRDTKKASKASKAKRKSNASALAEDEDNMDVDEEEPAPKPKSKKRKKEPESDEDEEKPAKTPKTATKVKLSAPKTPASEPSNKKKAAKPKSSGKKSAAKAAKAAASDDDEAIDTPKADNKELTEAEMLFQKQKKVLYFRHKLQRGFLSRDTTPKEEEMKDMSDFLKELENYPNLEGSIIRDTKIHKVLKGIIKLASIPLDEEYHFKTRSHTLLQQWNKILVADPTAESVVGGPAEPRTEKAASDDGDTEKQAEEAEAGKAAAPEEEKEEKIEKKIGTTTEGEKEADNAADKPNGTEKVDEASKTDAPAVDSAPAEEYKPPADATDDEPAA